MKANFFKGFQGEEASFDSGGPVLSAKDFERLGSFIHRKYGIKMPEEKKVMLQSRLLKRLRVLEISTFKDYCDLLFDSPDAGSELTHMIDAVTTNKTDFFREPDHYEYLSQSVLPGLMEKYPGLGIERDMLIWSAGCATGEEPFTLAMVLSEFTKTVPGFRFKIIASDISSRALKKAQCGIYEEQRIEKIPAHLRKTYLMCSKDHTNNLFRFTPELRARVAFQRINLLSETLAESESIPVIFCRNVIIYFDQVTQLNVLKSLYCSLSRDGYLFLGHSETLNGRDIPLKFVSPNVYRKMA